MKVVVKPAAILAIDKIVSYISTEIEMPETGLKYGERLIAFAFSLGEYWKAYKTCNYKPWSIRNLQCAVFDKQFVFAFKVIDKHVVIYDIKHGKFLH